jgi:hypothetical protein
VNYSNIHLSLITVDTDQVVKASRKTLLDVEDEYFVPESQCNPTLGQLNVLKENVVVMVAYPKVVQRLTTVSYPRPQEDRPESSEDEDEEGDVSSSGRLPDDYGISA